MPSRLYLTPTFDAGLEHALEQLQAARRARPRLPALVLLPEASAHAGVQRRLAGFHLTSGVRLFGFYSLARAILDAGGASIASLSDAAVHRVLQRCLQEMGAAGELEDFAPLSDLPGFQQALLEWLREMKSQGIPPESVRASVQPLSGGRDRPLAALYACYQAFLVDRGYSDDDGLLWLAAEALEADPQLLPAPGGTPQVVVLGFDQFFPIQVRLLAALAERAAEFSLYLPWDASRPSGSLAHSRQALTRRELEARLAPQVLPLADPRSQPRALYQLRRTLFETGSNGVQEKGVEEEAIALVEAPSREGEARAALRGVQKLLQAGVSTQEIALLAPQPGVYRRLVETVAEEYGAPVQVERSLGEQPYTVALLNLLRLAPDFPWRPTLDALRSPFLQQPWLGLEEIGQLERLSRERPVLSGREQWLAALRPVHTPGIGGDEDGGLLPDGAADDDLGPPRLAAVLTPQALAALSASLQAFFDRLTPPPAATYREYNQWLVANLLGPDPSLAPVGSPGTGTPTQPEDPTTPGDLRGTNQNPQPLAPCPQPLTAPILSCLHRLEEAAGLAPLHPGGVAPWGAYRRDLLALLAAQPMPAPEGEPGVRFANLAAGRWLSVGYLFILGLAEGEFPRLPPPDPFYAPVERGALDGEALGAPAPEGLSPSGAGLELGPHPLPLARRHPAADASLWWQALSNCRRQLTLLRPYLDEKGVPWLPSPYWEAVRAALPGVQPTRLPVAGPPALAEAASPGELLAAHALAASGETEAATRLPPALAGAPEAAAAWANLQAALAVARARQDWAPAPAYEGCLASPDLQTGFAGRYHPNHAWSVSALNRYGACPFSFYAERVLALAPLPDPEEGLDPLQRGQLLHAILEDLYRRLGEAGLAAGLDSQPGVFAALEAACDRLFKAAPERYGFRPGALWRFEQAELRRLLQAFVEWECAENTAGYRPYRQELRFGLGRKGASEPFPAVRLDAPSGVSFRLHGVIDRVDRDADGRLRILDYKSRSTPHTLEEIRLGLALQAPLYALAVERLLPEASLAESSYLYIPSRQATRLSFGAGNAEAGDGVVGVNGVDPTRVGPDQSNPNRAVPNAAASPEVAAALERAAAFVQAIQSARFPVAPVRSGSALPCDTCPYPALCRVDRHALAKNRRAAEVGS